MGFNKHDFSIKKKNKKEVFSVQWALNTIGSTFF